MDWTFGMWTPKPLLRTEHTLNLILIGMYTERCLLANPISKQVLSIIDTSSEMMKRCIFRSVGADVNISY
ncbi:hypothetical protein [Exiguobacterium artemiae]